MFRENYRDSDGKKDPFYCSTKNWKTLTQWKEDGYVPRCDPVIAYSRECGYARWLLDSPTPETLFRQYVYHKPIHFLLGYQSACCQMCVIRIHRSFMRKENA